LVVKFRFSPIAPLAQFSVVENAGAGPASAPPTTPARGAPEPDWRTRTARGVQFESLCWLPGAGKTVSLTRPATAGAGDGREISEK